MSAFLFPFLAHFCYSLGVGSAVCISAMVSPFNKILPKGLLVFFTESTSAASSRTKFMYSSKPCSPDTRSHEYVSSKGRSTTHRRANERSQANERDRGKKHEIECIRERACIIQNGRVAVRRRWFYGVDVVMLRVGNSIQICTTCIAATEIYRLLN